MKLAIQVLIPIKNVRIPCLIGSLVYLILSLLHIQTVLPKVAIIKLKSLKEMLSATEILSDLKSVSCCVLTIKADNCFYNYLLAFYSFFQVTPTIDKEPLLITYQP